MWKDIREDTTCIFQFESAFAAQTMKQMFSDETIYRIRQDHPDISYLKLMSFANALIRPCGASVRDEAVTGFTRKTGIKELDDMLSPELGFCIIQEDIMKFAMEFCGYSLLEADYLRKKIAKKGQTDQLIDELKRRFIETSQWKYNLTDEQTNSIIDPICQCVLDASRYAFSWNHSDAYSYIGYACGYLRHYYPLEFITTGLNIYRDNEEKTATIVALAKKYRFKILEPKFRYSKADYFMDKSTNSIYKGMHSIKFLNEECSNQLYDLRDNKYDTFIDLLYDVKQLDINSRQIEILIKLDYFREFGNAKELLKIYEMFAEFKNGDTKTINKYKYEKDQILTAIISRHSKETAKQFTQVDTKGVLLEVEEYIKCMNLEDISLREKIEVHKEYLGYIGINTGEEKDRPKLIILSMKTLLSKFGRSKGKPWCVMITTHSIGSGIQGTFVVPYGVYKKEPFKEMDTIYVDEWNRKGKFNYIYKEHLIFV